MRKLNQKCIVCGKGLYRRPNEIKRTRYFSCIEHREIAKKMFPLTDKQKEALKLGHSAGGKSRKGYKWSEEIKEKISKSHIKYCEDNKEERLLRGEKISGQKHYLWKGGITKVQVAIRTSARNKNWMKTIKERDNYECRLCKSKENLEVHHIMPIRELIEKYNIKSHKDTYVINDFWNIDNGITVCSKCHSLIDNKRKWN